MAGQRGSATDPMDSANVSNGVDASTVARQASTVGIPGTGCTPQRRSRHAARSTSYCSPGIERGSKTACPATHACHDAAAHHDRIKHRVEYANTRNFSNSCGGGIERRG